MPRIRTIKPEFYSSGKQLRLSIEAAFLLPCLWTHADDAGRMVDDDLEIGARCPRLMGRVAPILDELAEAGFIHRYEIGGRRYMQVHDFDHHQKINRPTGSRIPALEDSRRTHGGLTEDSLGIGSEGKEGKDRKGGECEGRGTTSPKGSSPPVDNSDIRTAIAESIENAKAARLKVVS